MYRRTHYYGSYSEAEIGFSVPPLPFVPLGVSPPCADRPDVFTLAGDDPTQTSITRNGRLRLESAERTAKAICQTCPLKQACRTYAFETRQTWGIWGSTSSTEREHWHRAHPAGQMPTEDDMSAYDDVPTIPLFDDKPLRVSKSKPKNAPNTIAGKGNCPSCTKNPATLIRIGDHFAWKEHTYRTWGNTVATCRTSGVALCIAPEPKSKPYNATPVSCPHDTPDGTRP